MDPFIRYTLALLVVAAWVGLFTAVCVLVASVHDPRDDDERS